MQLAIIISCFLCLLPAQDVEEIGARVRVALKSPLPGSLALRGVVFREEAVHCCRLLDELGAHIGGDAGDGCAEDDDGEGFGESRGGGDGADLMGGHSDGGADDLRLYVW